MRLTVMIKHGRKNALQPIKEISEDSLFCLLYVIPIPRASTSGCACYILQTNELTWVVKNAVTCGHRSWQRRTTLGYLTMSFFLINRIRA